MRRISSMSSWHSEKAPSASQASAAPCLPPRSRVAGADGRRVSRAASTGSRIWSRCSLRVVRRSAASSDRAKSCALVVHRVPPPGLNGEQRQRENMGLVVRKKRSTADVTRRRDNTGPRLRKSWRSRNRTRRFDVSTCSLEAMRRERATARSRARARPNCSNRAGRAGPRLGPKRQLDS